MSRSKYRAVRTTVDNIQFASKREANRYRELRLLERGGYIRDLTLQPGWPIEVNGRRVCMYWADFSYIDTSSGEFTVEDSKGFRTPVYALKKKLVEACYPEVVIREV